MELVRSIRLTTVIAVSLLLLPIQALSETVFVSPFSIKIQPEKDYLATGLQEVLISRLETKKDIKAIKGNKLKGKVEYMIKGSLEKRGGYTLSLNLLKKEGKAGGLTLKKTFKERVGSEDEILSALDRLSKEISKYLNNLETKPPHPITLPKGHNVTSPSIVKKEKAEASTHTLVAKTPPKKKSIEGGGIQYAPDLPPEEGGPGKAPMFLSIFKHKQKRHQGELPPYSTVLPVPTPEELEGHSALKAPSVKKANRKGIFSMFDIMGHFRKEETQKPEEEMTIKEMETEARGKAKKEEKETPAHKLPRWKWF